MTRERGFDALPCGDTNELAIQLHPDFLVPLLLIQLLRDLGIAELHTALLLQPFDLRLDRSALFLTTIAVHGC